MSVFHSACHQCHQHPQGVDGINCTRMRGMFEGVNSTHLRGTCECVNDVDGTCLMYVHKGVDGINRDTGCIVWTLRGRQVRKSGAKPVVKVQ